MYLPNCNIPELLLNSGCTPAPGQCAHSVCMFCAIAMLVTLLILARSIIYDSAGGAEGQSYLGGLQRLVHAVRAPIHRWGAA